VSETKETESGAEAQAEAATEGAPPSKPDAESTAPPEAPGSDADEAGEGADAARQAPAAPKKKKKKREAVEPETIRDRNARIRAEAADKRRSRREREQGTAPRRNLDASEVVDDALARSTHAAAGFLKKHFNKVQWVIMAGLASWIGYEVYSWRHDRTAEKTSEALFKALAAETGKVGPAEPDMGDDRGLPSDERRSFATDEERLNAAKKEYQAALAANASSATAELGLAGVAYDLGQYKEAQAAYEKVKQNAAFAKDNDIKGRTLEGLGMTLEALKNEDGALKAFRELQSMDSANFSALGMYHQARILKQNGKTDEALKLLDKAGDKLQTLKETPALIRYVGRQVLELLESIDAKKATELTEKLLSTEAKKQRDEMGALGPGGKNMSADMQRRIQELMEKMKHEAPPASSGAPAPAPAPAPAAPTQDAPPQDAPPQDAPAPAPSGAP
jgi:tetratricopeptide (TPR) repeat protein